MADQEPLKQVSILVHREVFDRYGPGELEYLKSFLGSYIFQQFCKDNKDVVQADLSVINPMTMSVENYTKLSNDMRLIWRFWTDLLVLAEELQPRE